MILAALKLVECRCSTANYFTFRLEEQPMRCSLFM